MSIAGKLLKRSALLGAEPGDVLVVRYSGRATHRDAQLFVENLIRALREVPAALRPVLPKIQIVIAAKGVSWSLEKPPCSSSTPSAA